MTSVGVLPRQRSIEERRTSITINVQNERAETIQQVVELLPPQCHEEDESDDSPPDALHRPSERIPSLNEMLSDKAPAPPETDATGTPEKHQPQPGEPAHTITPTPHTKHTVPTPTAPQRPSEIHTHHTTPEQHRRIELRDAVAGAVADTASGAPNGKYYNADTAEGSPPSDQHLSQPDTMERRTAGAISPRSEITAITDPSLEHIELPQHYALPDDPWTMIQLHRSRETMALSPREPGGQAFPHEHPHTRVTSRPTSPTNYTQPPLSPTSHTPIMRKGRHRRHRSAPTDIEKIERKRARRGPSRVRAEFTTTTPMAPPPPQLASPANGHAHMDRHRPYVLNARGKRKDADDSDASTVEIFTSYAGHSLAVSDEAVRLSWGLQSPLEVYSYSRGGWYRAHVTRILSDEDSVEVQYLVPNLNTDTSGKPPKLLMEKVLPRFDACLRPAYFPRLTRSISPRRSPTRSGHAQFAPGSPRYGPYTQHSPRLARPASPEGPRPPRSPRPGSPETPGGGYPLHHSSRTSRPRTRQAHQQPYSPRAAPDYPMPPRMTDYSTSQIPNGTVTPGYYPTGYPPPTTTHDRIPPVVEPRFDMPYHGGAYYPRTPPHGRPPTVGPPQSSFAEDRVAQLQQNMTQLQQTMFSLMNEFRQGLQHGKQQPGGHGAENGSVVQRAQGQPEEEEEAGGDTAPRPSRGHQDNGTHRRGDGRNGPADATGNAHKRTPSRSSATDL